MRLVGQSLVARACRLAEQVLERRRHPRPAGGQASSNSPISRPSGAACATPCRPARPPRRCRAACAGARRRRTTVFGGSGSGSRSPARVASTRSVRSDRAAVGRRGADHARTSRARAAAVDRRSPPTSRGRDGRRRAPAAGPRRAAGAWRRAWSRSTRTTPVAVQAERPCPTTRTAVEVDGDVDRLGVARAQGRGLARPGRSTSSSDRRDDGVAERAGRQLTPQQLGAHRVGRGRRRAGRRASSRSPTAHFSSASSSTG